MQLGSPRTVRLVRLIAAPHYNGGQLLLVKPILNLRLFDGFLEACCKRQSISDAAFVARGSGPFLQTEVLEACCASQGISDAADITYYIIS